MSETTPDTSPPTPRWAGTAAGRTDNGTFAPGNKFGRGTPNRQKVYALKQMVLAATTEEQVTNVMKALYEAATGGDVAACTVWLKYTIGPPPQAIEVTTGDDPIRVDMASLTQVVLTALGDHPDARVAVAAALRANRVAQADGGDSGPSD